MSAQNSKKSHATFAAFDPLNDAANSAISNGASANGASANKNRVSASEVDARRAQQLLDRAFALWEKGDANGAVLACRQSLTLAPRSSGAYSMLGLLLERHGDVAGAIAAYERAVEIEPSSLLERDSARRLRALSSNGSSPTFHFEEDELFGAPAVAPATTVATAVAAPTSSTRSTVLPPQNAVTSPETNDVAPPFEIYSVPIPSASTVPTNAANRGAPNRGAPNRKDAPFFATPSSFAPHTTLEKTGAASALLAMWRNAPTFWLRSLPLFAVAGTSFLVLLWSRGVAIERERRVVASSALRTNVTSTGMVSNGAQFNVSAPNASTPNASTPNASASNTVAGNTVLENATTRTFGAPNNAIVAASPALPAATSNARNASSATGNIATGTMQIPASSGLIVDNRPAKKASSGKPSVGGANSVEERRVGAQRDEVESRRRRPQNSPREVSGASERTTSSTGSQSPTRRFVPETPALPPADVSSFPRSSDTAAPNGNALPSVGDAPQTDESGNGASGNSGTRPYSGPLPSFPSPQVQPRTQNEIRPPAPREGAAASAQNAAYEYQTRALIFVEQGNNARAARDFQNAITMYRRQIARGDRVDEAQRGLEACRKGLSLVTSS